MVYGMGFFNGSNVFAIQSSGDNNTISGIFLINFATLFKMGLHNINAFVKLGSN